MATAYSLSYDYNGFYGFGIVLLLVYIIAGSLNYWWTVDLYDQQRGLFTNEHPRAFYYGVSHAVNLSLPPFWLHLQALSPVWRINLNTNRMHRVSEDHEHQD